MMQTHNHTCHFCPTQGVSQAKFSPQLVLPEDWMWLTRHEEGKDAVAVCPPCWPKESPRILLRRIGGPMGRRMRGGNR